MILGALVLLGGSGALAAGPLRVPEGCPAPSRSYHHVFYIDPVHGSMNGDGSAPRPWRTLAEVIDAGLISTMPTHFDDAKQRQIRNNPNAPIKPGDAIFLRSGDHGSIILQGTYGGPLVGYDNSDFITIAAEPGQTPLLRELKVLGGNKWVFEGLTIENIHQNLFNPGDSLVTLEGPHKDIVITGNHIMSTADASQWGATEWLKNSSDGLFDYAPLYNGASCISIVGNHFKNVATAMKSQRSDRVLIKDNRLDYWVHDGLDYGSNDMLIEGNVFVNKVDAGDALELHPDFMQGQPWGWGPGTGWSHGDSLSNIVITGNVLIRQTDLNLKTSGFIQGIDTFDGDWHNLRITNNVVITDAYQGISFYGVHDVLIANNILLSDGAVLRDPFTGEMKSWAPLLVVQHQKREEGGAASSNVTIRDNVVSGLTPDPGTINLVVRNNLCATDRIEKCILEYAVGGVGEWTAKPGVYDGGNAIGPMSREVRQLVERYVKTYAPGGEADR